MYTLAAWLALIPLAFVMLFAIIGGVSFGMPLAAVLPGRKLAPDALGRLTPVWESTYLFLSAAVLATLTIFTPAFAVLAPLVQGLWGVTAVVLAVRTLLVLGQAVNRRPGLTWMLVCTSIAVPVLVVQNATILLTGSNDVWQHAGLAIALGALAAALPPALWGGYFYAPGAASRQAARVGYWLALLLALFTLPLALVLDSSVLDGRSLLALLWPVMAAAVLGVVCLASERRRRYFLASATLVIGLCLSVYLTLWPYLLRPVLRVDNLLSSAGAQIWLALAFAVLAVVVLPAMYWLHRTATAD